MLEVRCKKCNKLLGRNLDGRIEIVCPRCSTFNAIEVLITADKDNIKSYVDKHFELVH